MVAATAAAEAPARGSDRLVIAGASAGTVFEWYDFYLYGSLATFITEHFFSGVNATTGYIFALLAFAAGFAVRPFGALVFGRLGDLWGRKNTFLVTMLLMGVSTFVVGLLPGYDKIGVAAPIGLIVMRLIQGLALGGEYGGAATYVAEHAPAGKRGLYTSWIQTTATFGLFLSLIVIILVRTRLGEDAFKAWGWRVPFLASAALLVVSLWIRLRLNESPVFQRMVAEGSTSKAPLAESFARWPNLKLVLLALAGLPAGPAECAFQFDPVGKTTFGASCELAKSALANAGVSYANQAAPTGSVAVVRIGAASIPSFRGEALSAADLKTQKAAWTKTVGAAL